MIDGRMFEEVETGDSAFSRKDCRQKWTKEDRCMLKKKSNVYHNYLEKQPIRDWSGQPIIKRSAKCTDAVTLENRRNQQGIICSKTPHQV